jgi:hypothetical protein
MSFGAGASYGPYSSREMHKYVRYGVDKKDGGRVVEKPSFTSIGTKDKPEPYQGGKVHCPVRFLSTHALSHANFRAHSNSLVGTSRPLEVQALALTTPPNKRRRRLLRLGTPKRRPKGFVIRSV